LFFFELNVSESGFTVAIIFICALPCGVITSKPDECGRLFSSSKKIILFYFIWKQKNKAVVVFIFGHIEKSIYINISL